MKLTCIGTGTAAPEPDRVCSGYLLQTGALRLLFDCGPGVVHGMARLGTDWRLITHLVLTHFHNDHIGDVPMLFFAWKHGMRPSRSRPLTVVGPLGTRHLLDKMAVVFGTHVTDTSFDVRLEELAPGEELGLTDVVRLRAGRTMHTPESLAFRVDAGPTSFCYSGDTGVSADLARFAHGVDTLLLECSLPDEQAMDTHLSPSGVAGIAQLAAPDRLLLTHVYPQLDRVAVPQLVRQAGWNGTVILPADGDAFEV